MATEDPWGLTPQPVDPPARDIELGMTTSDDTDPWTPAPVTRTVFAMAFAHAGYGLLRTTVLRLGVHRRKRLL